MPKETLNDFIERGYLDRSLTELYDGYYEPAWWSDADSYTDNDLDALDAAGDMRTLVVSGF